MQSLEKGALLAAACLALAAGCTEDRSETGPSGVAGVSDDHTLVAMVERKIEGEAALGSQPIDVDAENGVIKLSGRVQNGVQKEKAEELAEQVAGVDRVENDLVVARSPEAIPPPAEPAMPPPGAGGMPPQPGTMP